MKISDSICRPWFIIMTGFTSHQLFFLKSVFRLSTQGCRIAMLERIQLVIAWLYNTQHNIGFIPCTLVDANLIAELKEETKLKEFTLTDNAENLLKKINECVPSTTKLRVLLRKHIGETHDFDLLESYGVNFIETLMLHYLNLMDSPLNPLSNKQLERTTAVNTTITILNNLFIDVNDVIGFKWYEIRTHMTNNSKWDGVGFSVKNKRLTPLLIEFSGGIKSNNNETKENNDINKLTKGCIQSIEYVEATTDLALPLPEYIVRFYDEKLYFESVVKLEKDNYIKRTYVVVPVPTRPKLLQDFFTKTVAMYQWRNAVIDLIKMAEKKNE